ncbi:RNA ligase, Rnl2 family [Flavobacterium sp.]|uniref:RNA ligase, Rnl2 family n=1 Tax=Flavobacterium sp. TaxID=239 RepID=UPI002605472A|nr:RNA ligase, Rnl2 family [Flavobacterium sp.]
MEFKKYNSIENAYQKIVLEQIIIHGFEKEIYVVQEKVHGANFSFFTDGKLVKIAKRTDFIQEDETFYNAQKVAEKYHDSVLQLFEKVKEQFDDIETLVIYGELFGGHYNHKDVVPIKEAIKVQKGIDYSPENDFYAFDIKLNGTHYLDVATANTFFETMNFFYAKTLFEGTLKEALKYPNEFNSKIPDWLGLTALEDNITEGVIIRPAQVKYFGNGSRVILKNKNEKWSEKTKVKRDKTVHKEVVFTENAQIVWEEIQTYITTNRLYNVLSKEGEFTPKMMGKITGLFAQDILTDFMKEQAESFNILEKEEQKGITKRLNNVIIKMIKEEFMTLKV